MSRADYDDMVSSNNKRGQKSTRATVLGVAFFIIVALIVIVLYLILNPGEKIEIREKNSNEAAKEEETRPQLFNFQNRSGETSPVLNEPEESDISRPQDVDIHTEAFVMDESTVVDTTVESSPLIENEEISQSFEEEMPLNVEEADVSSEVSRISAEDSVVPEESIVEEIPDVVDDITEIFSDTEEAASSAAVISEEVQEEETVPAETLTALVVMDDEVMTYFPVESESSTVEEDVSEDEGDVFNPLAVIEADDIITSSVMNEENGRLILTGKNGSAVRAGIAGRVSASGKDEDGKYVIVTSPEGWSMKYSGFERVVVRKKAKVTSDTVLGSIGSSSSSITITYVPAEE